MPSVSREEDEPQPDDSLALARVAIRVGSWMQVVLSGIGLVRSNDCLVPVSDRIALSGVAMVGSRASCLTVTIGDYLTLRRCLSAPQLVLQILLLTLFSFIEGRLDMPGHSEFFMYSTICTTSIMVVAGIVGAFPTSMRFTYGVLRTFVPLSLSGSTRGSRSPVCRLSFRPLLNHPTWSYRRPDDLEEGYFAAGWP